MSNSHIYRPIQDTAGNLITTAQVGVYQPGTTTPITATLYADAALSQPLANPFLAASGFVDFYLSQPQTVRLGLIQSGQPTTYIENIDVGEPFPKAPITHTFYVPGNQSVLAVPQKHYVEAAATITSVRAAIGTIPTGTGSLTVDVRSAGTSVWTTPASEGPSIAAGGSVDNALVSSFDHPSLPAGSQLTIAVLSVGGTTPGADLVVQVTIQPN